MLLRLTILALLAFAGQAMAQATPTPPAAPPVTPAPEPQRTTATFGDWTLQCLRPEKAAPTCELVQTLFNQGNPFARTAIGRTARGEPLRLAIVVPVNVNLTLEPHMAGADNEAGFAPVDLTWRRCVPQGCFADMPLSDDQLKRLRARTDNARIIFQDSGGKEAVMPFGPHGLGQALDAMVKEEAAK